MSLKKILVLWWCLFLASGAVLADTLALNPTHPERYIVVKGDTLWDISERFLTEPWRWPEIWEVNPQIRNPHLIYPGDEISLSYKDGKPVLRVHRRGRPTVKLSPGARTLPRESGAIPTIPIDAIKQFLSRPRVVAEGELDAAPYIVSVGKEHLVAGKDHSVYVRGVEDAEAVRYAVLRSGPAYTQTVAGKEEILGYEAVHVADALVERAGDPATMRLTSSSREVRIGDRLLPVQDERADQNFMPRVPDSSLNGEIIAVLDGVTQVGQYQVVVLNLGEREGIEVGHVMAVYQRGIKVKDPYAVAEVREDLNTVKATDPDQQGGAAGLFASVDRVVQSIHQALTPESKENQVHLPEERAGILMVFRPFERVSYALVMDAIRPMHIADKVRNP